MIGVVGLGIMGLGIAQVFAAAGHAVIATDVDAEARAQAHPRLRATLAPRIAAGKTSESAVAGILGQIRIVSDLSDFEACTLVIEAVVERLDIKKALFAELETIVPRGCLLATNTSALSVSNIFVGLNSADRGIGLHFFNPAPAMKLVELVAGASTSDKALSAARTLCEGVGKVVVTCADRPGFIVNRCARPFYGEALMMLEEGRAAADIDAAMVENGYRMGPFALIDLVGADINLAATLTLAKAMGGHPRYHVFDALKAAVARGDLGRKTGTGFVTGFSGDLPPTPRDAPAVALRIEATVANEAAYLLGEGAVGEADIDTALTLGLNFPRGAFAAARAQGLDRMRAELRRLEAGAPSHLRGRYAIAPALERMQ